MSFASSSACGRISAVHCDDLRKWSCVSGGVAPPSRAQDLCCPCGAGHWLGFRQTAPCQWEGEPGTSHGSRWWEGIHTRALDVLGSGFAAGGISSSRTGC